MGNEDGDETPIEPRTTRYMREWRRNNPDARKRQKDVANARQEALRRLAHKYKTEFDAIYAEVREERDV